MHVLPYSRAAAMAAAFCLIGAQALLPNAAAAATLRSLVRVSAPSPCVRGPVPNQPNAQGVYSNAEVEPYVAINPKRTSSGQRNLIGVWQQDRRTGGAAQAAASAYSMDGGKTWHEVTLPFSACGGNNTFPVASDPWVSFGPDGTAYAAVLALSGSTSAILAATSRDGGKTWSTSRTVAADPANKVLNDKESVTADPTRSGVAYMVWDQPFGGGNSAPTLFSSTQDAGATWSSPRVILPGSAASSTVGNEIVVDPKTGYLYDFFFNQAHPAASSTVFSISYIRSTNAGKSWSGLKTVSRVTPSTGASGDPDLRTGGLPDAVINPRTGAIDVVWGDGRFSTARVAGVAFSSSSDGGKHWSTPRRVNPPSSRDVFTPALAVNNVGMIGVTYYRLGSESAGDTALPASYFITFSTDGGKHFTKPRKLAGPFDMKSAPKVAGGYFLGDYQGLAASGSYFFPFFVTANTGDVANPTDVFAARVKP